MQSTGGRIKNKAKSIFIALLAVIIAVCTLLITFGQGLGMPSWSRIYAFFGVSENFDADFSAAFLNVGTADACVVKCGEKILLVDTGLSLTYDKLNSFLGRHKITHIDALILSHTDNDHIGGAAKVLDSFDVDVVYMPQIPSEIISESVEYVDLLNSLKENNLKVEHPKSGEALTIGDMTLEFIMPDEVYNNTNDSSLVFRLSFKEISVLFTGDISSKVEEEIINSSKEIKSDVLKVAHHGSKTSSSEQFLAKADPKISVVSAGKSSADLPDYTTMARLDKYSDELYCTAEDKTVVINSDGSNLTVQTGY